MQSIQIIRPDDWHVHLRDGPFLEQTVQATALHFSRALVMPNLTPPLVSISALIAYRQRILAHLSKDNPQFSPMMTLFLQEKLDPSIFAACAPYPFIVGAKLYPAKATTNAQEGITSLPAIYPLLEAMQQHDRVLQIHGEVNTGDVFSREAHFVQTQLSQIIKNFPRLRIVLEHISTKIAVEFVQQASSYIAATITPHHLLYNRNRILASGIHPHYYCLPILKKEEDRLALLKAAASGNPAFFAGTDSAPHAIETKENACGCAGIYSAPYAVAMYATAFEEAQSIHRLEAFLSHFGADFYQVPRNKDTLQLLKKAQTIPAFLPFGETKVIPVAAEETLPWSVDCDSA